MSHESTASSARPRRLLDQVHDAIRARHYSPRTAEAYCTWVRRFVLFHGTRHPNEMGAHEIEAFLNHLATDQHVSASTQNQALAALLFLYVHVLSRPVGELGDLTRAKRPHRLPMALVARPIEVCPS